MTGLIRKLAARAPAALCALTGAALAAVLALLTIGQSGFGRYYRMGLGLSNAALLGIGAGAVALLMAACLFFARRRRGAGVTACAGASLSTALPTARLSRVPWALLVADLLLLVAQLLITRATWYYPSWDMGMCRVEAESLALTGGVSSDYFTMCPNNAPFTLLISLPLWVGYQLGLSVPYALLAYLSAALLNLACLMTALCVRKLTQSRLWTGVTFAVCAMWLGLSSFMNVPYTDVFAIAIPVLALYCWLTVRRPFPRWLLVTLLCFFGYSLKPSVLILWIALALLGGFDALRRIGEKGLAKRVLLVLAAIVLGFAPAKLWKDGATARLAGSATPEQQLSETHYLMMGLNTETTGGHSPEDVAFSRSFATLADRRAANLSRALERLRAMSPAQALRFFAAKAYKAHADGTFASDGSFLAQEIPRRTGKLTQVLRSLYDQKGANRTLLKTVDQVIWLAVLLFAAIGALCVRGKAAALPLIALALFGNALYLLLVEVWPRYLFVYAPFYLLMAVAGARWVAEKVRNRKGR